MTAIETNNLTKDYAVGFWRKRPRRVLHELDLTVETGEVFGLLGPNGAGKSTTLKILLRLIFPTSGTARILGRPLHDMGMHARIGFLPENPYFYDHLTPTEFLNYTAQLFGMPADDRRRRVASLIERVGLSEARDVPMRKFSKGMVQRLGVAQALINDPELVILDEPMSGLDPLGRREVRDIILGLREEGKTVLFSTHILPDAESLCDRVAILDRGRLQGCGELREILGLEAAATEVSLDKPRAELLREVGAHTSSVVRTGDRVRLVVPKEEDVRKVLDAALRHGAKVVSVNPVKASLEDYFLSRVTERTEAAPPEHAGEGKGGDRGA